MKVRTFVSHIVSEDLENEINQWLRQNPNISIMGVTQSSLGNSPGVVVIIWYEK